MFLFQITVFVLGRPYRAGEVTIEGAWNLLHTIGVMGGYAVFTFWKQKYIFFVKSDFDFIV